MVSVSPKLVALTLLASAGLLLTLHLKRDDVRLHDDLFVDADQVEMLIRTLEARKGEPKNQRIVDAEQLLGQDAISNLKEESSYHKEKQSKAKSFTPLKGDDSQKKKEKKKRKKEKQSELAEHVDDRNDESTSGNTEDEEAEDHEEIVDMNDPERLKRHKKTTLKKLPRDKYWPVSLSPSFGRVFKELDLDDYSAEDAEYLRSRLPEYQERAERVSRGCSERPNLVKDKTDIKTLVWDTRHTPHLIWCQLPKIASASWNADFFAMGHEEMAPEKVEKLINDYEEDDEQNDSFNLHREVFRLFPAPNTTFLRNKVFTNAVRFMIVRHPFVRLVSAYRDKITQDDPKPVWFHYEKLQQLIIKRYRPADSTVNDEHPTFFEFISFVIDQTEGLTTKKDWRKVTCWKPYHISCGVCAHDMQMILKLETLNEDTRFLATLAGLDMLKKKTMWRHLLNGTSSDALSLEYFERLTKSQVTQLHQRYKTDFDLFGYSPQKYIDRAQDE